MARRLAAWAIFAVAIGWGAAIGAAPLAQGASAGDLQLQVAGLSYLVGSFVCHQRPERSFHVAGAQLPVCARCAALYWGGAIGLAGWLVFRRDGSRTATAVVEAQTHRAPINRTLFAHVIFILGLPIAVTLASSAAGWWDSSNAFRAVTSAPFGIAVGAMLAAFVRGDLS